MPLLCLLVVQDLNERKERSACLKTPSARNGNPPYHNHQTHLANCKPMSQAQLTGTESIRAYTPAFDMKLRASVVFTLQPKELLFFWLFAKAYIQCPQNNAVSKSFEHGVAVQAPQKSALRHLCQLFVWQFQPLFAMFFHAATQRAGITIFGNPVMASW